MKRLLLLLPTLSLCCCDDASAPTPPSRHLSDEAAAERMAKADPLRAELPLTVWCAACHAQEFEAWKGSHHALAWRKTAEDKDAARFAGQTLRAHGTELHFTRGAEGSLLLRDAGTGEEYPIVAAVGHSPLVQYMVKGERGAYQCPSAAWDTEKGEWFDTVEDDARLRSEGATERRRGDWGHWLGRGMTWNAQCAWCHMSGFAKNYDAETDSYASTWQEPGVTCIQCHSLGDRPTLANGRPVRRNKDKKLTARQIGDSCASCHARREELRPGFREGDLFDDYFRLELPLVEGIFWPNGTQRDECYTETGMRLSPMGKAGVTCADCHTPHSALLRLPQEDNSLCLRCHGKGESVNGTKAPVIDMATHTPCPQGSAGWQCVSCHMPETRYMARDARRDHAFTSPDPQLSEELGIPNACTQCHTNKDNAWAAAAVAGTYGESPKMAKYRPRTRAIAAAMKGAGNAEALLAAYRSETNPTWQATLMELLARGETTDAIREEARKAAASETPLLRAAAARVLGSDAPQLLQDPVRVVRLAATWAQLDTLLERAEPSPALLELEETLRHQADHPAAAMQQAILEQARARHALRKGDSTAATAHLTKAEQLFRRALSLDPASATVRMDFAVFLAQQSRPVDALEQMLACTAAHPQNAEAQYRLALILFELGHEAPARRALEKAVKLNPAHERAQGALRELQGGLPPASE